MEAVLSTGQTKPEDWQKLEGIYTNLEAKYPDAASIKNGHAEFLWSRGEERRAVDTWLAAEKLDPNSGVILEHLGGSFLGAGEVKKAAAYFVRAIQSAPENAAYHFSYANVAFLFRHELHDAAHPDSDAMADEAMKHFAEAARLQPHNAEYARAFAETFYILTKPDWQTALRAWQHFYEVSPQKDFALVNLARVQLKLGQKAEARASLEGVQGPEYRGIKERLSQRAAEELNY
ncbi:MAG TPA: tetratricopeptide repeat protein [Chthoniobacter sp.]|jgi:tetratricopeptide (TPR) repeat protein